MKPVLSEITDRELLEELESRFSALIYCGTKGLGTKQEYSHFYYSGPFCVCMGNLALLTMQLNRILAGGEAINKDPYERGMP
jgi:hypothetical protein